MMGRRVYQVAVWTSLFFTLFAFPLMANATGRFEFGKPLFHSCNLIYNLVLKGQQSRRLLRQHLLELRQFADLVLKGEQSRRLLRQYPLELRQFAGFWSKHYPAIAKELRRRYPRHAWPDDPLTARPPAPRR